MLETASKKIKIVNPGDKVIVPVPDLGRAKIDAHLHHRRGASELPIQAGDVWTSYFLSNVGNKI